MTGEAREASACSAAMRTSGLPPISARSLFGPPMRVERPAASTTAAMRWSPAATGSSRGCGRVTISISRPPTPRPVMASRGTSSPASRRMSTQSNPFSFGRARAARRAEQRTPARIRQQQEIARDRPACRNARSGRRSPRPRPGSHRAGRRSRRRRTRSRARRPRAAPLPAPWRAPSARAAPAARRRSTRRPARAVRWSRASVFSTTLSASPGRRVETTPTLRMR